MSSHKRHLTLTKEDSVNPIKEMDKEKIFRLMVKARALEERLIKMNKAGESYFWIGGPGEEALGSRVAPSRGSQVRLGAGLGRRPGPRVVGSRRRNLSQRPGREDRVGLPQRRAQQQALRRHAAGGFRTPDRGRAARKMETGSHSLRALIR